MEADGPAALDLGQLLRLRGMAESATRGIEIDWAAGQGLTESYNRLRREITAFVKGTALEQEFDRAFPEIDPPARVRRPDPRSVAEGASAAQHAASLLGQLAGWLDGFVQEQTLEQRLRLEAEERVKQERKQAPGFQ